MVFIVVISFLRTAALTQGAIGYSCRLDTANVRMSRRAETPSARNNIGIGRLDPVVRR